MKKRMVVLKMCFTAFFDLIKDELQILQKTLV